MPLLRVLNVLILYPSLNRPNPRRSHHPQVRVSPDHTVFDSSTQFNPPILPRHSPTYPAFRSTRPKSRVSSRSLSRPYSLALAPTLDYDAGAVMAETLDIFEALNNRATSNCLLSVHHFAICLSMCCELAFRHHTAQYSKLFTSVPQQIKFMECATGTRR